MLEIESLSLHFLCGGPSLLDAQGSFDFSLQLPDVVNPHCSTFNFNGFPSLTTLALSFNSHQHWGPLTGSFFMHPSLQKVVLYLPTFEDNGYWQFVPYASPVTELHLLQ